MKTLLPKSAEVLARLPRRHCNLAIFRFNILPAIAVILLLSLAIPRVAAIQPLAPGDWIWTDGSSTIGSACVSTYPCGQLGVYGTRGTVGLGNTPGSRSDAMSWTGVTGTKWLFGGFGYGAGGALGEMNDLWQADTLGNGWGWISGSNGPGHSGVYGTLGTPSSSTVPGGRQDGMTWTDKSGNLWLFGGLGYDGSGTGTYGYENDLWMYNTTTNQWTWESGSSTVPAPTSTIYGTLIGASAGVYGTLGTPAAGNTPSGRTNATAWTDSNGNLWLFGGGVVDEFGYEDVYNDLWEFNTTTKLWTWVGGGSSLDELGVYGTFQTAASGNAPGARFFASGWTDSSGNFWLFGGSGYASNAGQYNLNDLWKFSTSTSQWTWMGGASTLYACNILFSTPCPVPGTYGTLGTAASTNFPGGRNAATTWIDSSGNLWLFGGAGQDANNLGAWLNDLWEYNPGTTEWTWMGGSSTIPSTCATGNCGQPGVYGSLGTAASTSVPGARQTAVSWTDQSGNFWLFGGWGEDANGTTGYLNDMWEYQPPSASTTPQAATPTFSEPGGTYFSTQTVIISDTTLDATIYYTTNGTTPTTGSSVYGGAITVSSTETIEAIAVAGGDTTSATASATYTITPPAATPTFSVPAGTYFPPQTVIISDTTPGATIYYTTNGTSPATSPLTYSEPITVSSTETLEALATASGYSTSAVATAAYTITPPATGTPNEWVWMGGSSTLPGASAGKPGVYGTLGTAAAGNIPGGRYYPSTWTDSSGNLWVFGGYSADPAGDTAALNDLWKFNPATNEWTWISGSNATPYYGTPAGVYGTLGTPAAGNTPGGRESAATWVDENGNLWLFGGFGAQSYGVQTNYLNDLWEFNPSTGLWTWMGGSGPVSYSIPAVYGTLGTPASANIPGARQGATTWTDSSGNFWLFGGYGAASDTNGYLNDLWEFNPSTKQWTWMAGSSSFAGHCFSTQTYSLCGVPGVFGTLGTPAAGNTPGGNQFASVWTDSGGNVWLFGGYGTDSSGNFGDLNDLWKYSPSTNLWTWMGGSMLGPFDNGTPAVYGTLGTFAASNLPGGRQAASSWTDSSGNFWLFGGNGIDASGTITASGGSGSLNDLWEFSPSKGDWAWMGGSNMVGANLGQPGVYGTLGTATAGNAPGGHQNFASFTDKSGNFWLFAGAGFDSTDTAGFLNDLWEYQNPTGATITLLPAATPTFSLAGGTYAGAQTTTISDSTPNPTIYYTTDGTTPTINSPVYTGAISLPYVGLAETIQAFVTAPGYAPSAVATVVYTITAPVETAVATPTFTPIAGTYSSAQTVTITDATPGATIYYTIDGSTPTTTPGISPTSTVSVYSSGIPITSTGTVKAIAAAVNYYNSAVASATFTIAPPVVSPIGNWVWMGGSSNIPDSASGQPGVYGTLGTPAAGNIPGGRDNGATWTDKSGNLWLMGGFGYDANGGTLGMLNDLWQFNPANNQWVWMGGSNTLPTCSSLCGQAGVYGTLGTPAAGNIPGGRDASATWNDSSGHLWLFGGSGFDSVDTNGFLNDLWEFNPSTGLWTWMGGSSTTAAHSGPSGVYGSLGTAAAGNIPGARVGAATWIDSSGHLWLFGGYGIDSTGTPNYLNDVWQFNTTTLQWTWMGGSSIGVSGGQPGVYGTLGTASAANIPGSRALASTWTDSSGHFWLFGGTVPAATPQYQDFNDLWELNPSTNQWTWMGGSSSIGSNCALQYTAQNPTCGQPGVYGTSGSPAAGNTPGGRSGAPGWIDSSGNLWLFGGTGMDSAGSSGLLDDLWSFNPSTKQWAWMGGSNVIGSDCLLGPNDNCGQPGIYGSLGSPAIGNIPGSRESASSWTDSSGHFWLFGGVGVDANGSHIGYLNDVWEYQPAVAVTTPAATPAFSVQGGNYSTAQTVTITDSTANATIYYTINGTTPTTGSSVYSGAISISSTETLEAIATASGYTTSATAVATYTITPVLTTPTVTVTPAASSITLAQSLSVTITVPCGKGCPTGTVILTGGYFTSSAVALSNGSATITIPADEMATGTDTLTATYTPDSNSSSTYNSATGTNTVFVSEGLIPTVTVTPASSSITTAQSLSVAITVADNNPCPLVVSKPISSLAQPEATCTLPIATGTVVLTGGGYTSSAVTLSSGSATIPVQAGALATGTDILTATYTPDSSDAPTYITATGTNSVTVTGSLGLVPTVTVTPAASSITTAQSLSVTILVADSNACPAFLQRPATAAVQVEACSNPFVATGSVVLSGGGYTSSAVTLSSGSASVTIPAGALATGIDSLTATYTPDSNSASTYTSATGANTVTVTAAIVTAPVASLTPPGTLTFTATNGATSAAQTVTLTNTGNAALAIASIAITGTNPSDFAETNNCGSSLAAGTNCAISVTFTPASATTFTAALSVTDNASGSPQSIALNGTGVALPSFTIGSPSPAGTITPGGTDTFTIAVTPQNGAFNSVISFAASGLPTGATATFNPTTVTLGSSAASTTLTITIPAAVALQHPFEFPFGTKPVTLAVLLLVFLPGKRHRRRIWLGLLLMASLGASTILSGCAGGFALPGPASTTYDVTVTASGGAVVQTTTLQLTVKE